jgi:hypothetical protein
MKSVCAKVIGWDCDECRDALLLECREFGLPEPIKEIILVPERWISHRCPHGKIGITLNVVEPMERDDKDDDREAVRADVEEVEAPDGWLNLDATRGIGYPAREQGRYGSHPSHDRFDGDSEP